MKILLLSAMFFLPSTYASGWESKDLNKLLGSMSCESCELTHVNLVKTDLRAAQLSGANLSEARLMYSSLIGAQHDQCKFV